MDTKQCSEESIKTVVKLVEEHTQKYIMYKTAYNRCIVEEKDEKKCINLYKGLEYAKWSLDSWTQFSNTRIEECKMLEKYTK